MVVANRLDYVRQVMQYVRISCGHNRVTARDKLSIYIAKDPFDTSLPPPAPSQYLLALLDVIEKKTDAIGTPTARQLSASRSLP